MARRADALGLIAAAAFFVAPALVAAPAAHANIYLFGVRCNDEAYVAQWDSGAPDPGKEYFRLATGDLNLDCTIHDYDNKTERDLPRRWCREAGGILRGFPPMLIILGTTHCH